MAEDIYYRTLYTKVHRERWDQGQFNSTNEMHGIPKEWVAAAVSGKPVEEYPLAADGVLFGATARERFVAFADTLRAGSVGPLTAESVRAAFDMQPLHAREQQLELAGVCAFTTPSAAYWYGQEPPKLGDELVAFTGVKVADLAPEQGQGGVIAAVIEPVCRLEPQAFLDKFCDGLQPPSPHLPAEKGKGLTWDGMVEEAGLPVLRAEKTPPEPRKEWRKE